jgi:hypothetical protein
LQISDCVDLFRDGPRCPENFANLFGGGTVCNYLLRMDAQTITGQVPDMAEVAVNTGRPKFL